MSDPTPPPAIDVDMLMDDLKGRVERRRADGEIDPRVLDLPFDADDGAPARTHVRMRPEVAYSSKPGVGRIITAVKRTAIRLLHHFVADLVAQINAALARLDGARRDDERARAELEDRAARQEEELADLRRRVAAMERRGDDVGA